MSIEKPVGGADHVVLVVQGSDRPGIVAAVTDLIARHGGNIISLDQSSDVARQGQFFQRVVFRIAGLVAVLPRLEADLEITIGSASDFRLSFRITDQSAPKRMAILASASDHCLLDLLWRHRRGELPVTVPMVVSNHTSSAADVRSFGIPFFHVPSRPGSDKTESESQILELLQGNVDFVVLARYMQILSEHFITQVGVPVINIHHSFLPAFVGADPYTKAKERGVKLIGATAHYVTKDLDEGPIIEQDTVRVSHADTVLDLRRRGADVERAVLSRAVTWHAQDRVIRHGNSTVVFAS